MFEEYFSRQSQSYLDSRPLYPAAIFELLSSLCAKQEIAWDCATGNGQVAIGLAEHFEKVIATDISQTQITHAIPRKNIEYRVAPGENSPIASKAVDLITVGQSAHWLDLNRFYLEARRVACESALIAIFGFREAIVTPSVDELISLYLHEVVGGYWPAGKELYDSRYTSLYFPFQELPAPDFKIEADWTLDQLLRLLDSYFGPQKYLEVQGKPLSLELLDEFNKAWGGKQLTRKVTIPLLLRVGRISK
jgi:hypothetical protein